MAEPGKAPELAKASEPAKVPEPAKAPETEPQSRTQPGAQSTTDAESAPTNILPASHWAQAPLPDDDDDDKDSSLGDDAASSTASLSASILEYRNIHGRTFHSNIGLADAWEPNDDQHGESLDIQHHAYTLLLGDKLYLAPLDKHIQKVVDIGTGTGIWAIDFADQFPNAKVIGTELSPMQPTLIPPNLVFEIDDANLDWTWADDTFDYIHVRGLFGNIVDWPKFYRDAFRCCKPGGWFEDHENSLRFMSDDESVAPGSPMDEWCKVFWEAGKKFGRTFRVYEDELQVKLMEEAGFVDVTVTEFKCPIGDWPRDPRQKLIANFTNLAFADIEGYCLYMWNAVMGWKREEILVYVAHLRRQLRDPKVHGYYRQRVVYGRKPT